MLRSVWVIALAVIVSFALSASGGYFLYLFSSRQSEVRLGLFARYIISPLIAVIVGALVGYLIRDHAGLTTTISLMPWGYVLSSSVSIGPILEYVLLAILTSVFVFRKKTRHLRRSTEDFPSA
jgi:MFS family permease